MQDAEMFAHSRIGHYYDKLFTTESERCNWLIAFILDQLQKAHTIQVQQFYVGLLNDAYAWKWRIQKQ